MRKNLITAILMIFLNVCVVFAQTGPLQWSSSVNRPGTTSGGVYPKESNNDVKHLSSGNVIGVGMANPLSPIVFSNDIAVRKYRSTDGVVIAQNYIDHYLANEDDEAVKVIVAEPYIYVLATCKFGTPSFDSDIVLYKMDTSLVVQWEQSFNGLGDVNDFAIDMGVDASGNIYVVGNTTRTATGGDIVLLKYTSQGIPVFTRYYSSVGNLPDNATDMHVETNGMCSITGSYGHAVHGSRLLGMKIWANGVKLWSAYHDVVSATNRSDIGSQLAVDPITSDIFVTGRGQNSTNDMDWVVVRFSGADGTKLWSKRYSGTASEDKGTGIVYTSTGELYSCGDIATSVSGFTSQNVQLRKLNPLDGSFVFTRTYNYANIPIGPSIEGSTGLIATPSGNVYMTGWMNYQTQTITQTNQLVLAYNATGTLLWSHVESSGSGSGFQETVALSAAFSNAHSALYVSGFKNITMSQAGYATMMKFNPVTVANPVADRIGNSQTVIGVYPNPASDFLVVSQEEVSEGEYAIYDLNGKCVLREILNQEETRINISMLVNGMYVIQVKTPSGNITEKFIKQ